MFLESLEHLLFARAVLAGAHIGSQSFETWSKIFFTNMVKANYLQGKKFAGLFCFVLFSVADGAFVPSSMVLSHCR